MARPQQPEIARSDRGEVSPVAPKIRSGGPTDESPAPAPVPEGNAPGHRPDEEQDKPDVRVADGPRGVRAGESVDPGGARANRRFGFAFDLPFRLAALPFGVHGGNAYVEVGERDLEVRFGRWKARTSLDNVADVQLTGPYSWPKVIGPAHVSLSDRGITFATNARRGVCIRLHRPVAAGYPLVRHPGLTVTVEDPEGLVRLLGDRTGR